MCAIMGYCDPAAPLEAFQNAFERSAARGPDKSAVVHTGGGLLGFHRLAIMGLHPEGMQPFERNGSYAVCNGELYGFMAQKRELEAKGYSFVSESDCELVLPLWFEYGVEMFRRLDAEFALILYDGKSG